MQDDPHTLLYLGRYDDFAKLLRVDDANATHQRRKICQRRDDDGQLPLHILCSSSVISVADNNNTGERKFYSKLMQLIKWVVEAYPDAILARTKSMGLTPLHMACNPVEMEDEELTNDTPAGDNNNNNNRSGQSESSHQRRRRRQSRKRHRRMFRELIARYLLSVRPEASLVGSNVCNALPIQFALTNNTESTVGMIYHLLLRQTSTQDEDVDVRYESLIAQHWHKSPLQNLGRGKHPDISSLEKSSLRLIGNALANSAVAWTISPEENPKIEEVEEDEDEEFSMAWAKALLIAIAARYGSMPLTFSLVEDGINDPNRSGGALQLLRHPSPRSAKSPNAPVHPLHAMASIPYLPLGLMKLAIQIHGTKALRIHEALLQAENNGAFTTPLEVAIWSSSLRRQQSLKRKLRRNQLHDIDDDPYCAVKEILAVDSSLAQPTQKGSSERQRRCPLFCAIDSGMEWYHGLDELVKSFPMALRMRDVTHGAVATTTASGLYPFMLAACNSHLSLSTALELLLACPELVADGT